MQTIYDNYFLSASIRTTHTKDERPLLLHKKTPDKVLEFSCEQGCFSQPFLYYKRQVSDVTCKTQYYEPESVTF